jgi:pimeloyl-ACP methyl ester carboxylesterase/DNA-binding CsgD family transcriptional regulator
MQKAGDLPSQMPVASGSGKRASDPVSPATVLALVEALYAYAEDPADWDDIRRAVDALGLPLDPARDAAAQTIIGHAARACAMIDRLNAGRRDRDATEASWDAILLSSEGVVRGRCGRMEERLRPYLSGAISPGRPLPLQRKEALVFGNAFATATRDEGSALVPFTLGSIEDNAACFGVIVSRAAFPASLVDALGLGPVWTEPMHAVVLLSAQDTETAGRLAHHNFGLTSAQARLAAKLLQGLRLADAAAALQMTLSTARWHLKNIFLKTGTRRQADLLRLLTQASSFPVEPAPARSMVLPGVPPRRLVTLGDQRQLCYREYGVATGFPVLYFHFGLSASMLPPAAVAGLAGTDLRVIAFERPGYGQSDPTETYSFESVAADVDELRQRLGLSRLSLFGDGYGGGFAVAAAHRLGRGVSRLALHAPNLGRSASNSADQRGMSVFHAQPWIIPTAAEMLRRGLRVKVIRSMLGYLTERSRSDERRVGDPEHLAYLNATIFDALERSSKGLAAELLLFGRKVHSDPRGLGVPIKVWHGEENAVVSTTDSLLDFGEHPHAELRILPDVGLYLDRSVFAEIFGWLDQR